jgi:O-antigen/teichoic acid export membrane protein
VTTSADPVSVPQSATRGLFRGTAANFVGAFVAMAVGFFTTPFFVHHLGSSAYGVYALVLVFTTAGYAGYLDFGLQGAVVREASLFAAAGRWRDVGRVTASGTAVLGAIGLGLGGLLIGLSSLLARDAFHVPVELRHSLVLALRVLGVILVLQFPSLIGVAALQLVHRWDLVMMLRTAALLGAVGAAAVLVATRGGLLSLVVPVLMGQLIGVAATVFYAYRIVPQFDFRPWHATREHVRTLLGTGLLIFSAQGGLIVVANLDQVLIGAFVDARTLGLYAIASAPYYAVFALYSISNSTVFAASSHYKSHDDRPRIRALFFRGTRYSGTLVLVGATAAAIWGLPFIVAWTGRQYREAGILLTIWLLHWPVTALTGIGWNMLASLDRLGGAVRLSTLSAALNIAASVVLLHFWGARGVILGTVIAYVITGPILIRLYLRAVGESASAFLREVVAPAYAAAACAGLVGLGLRLVLPTSLPVVVAAGAFTFAAGLVAAWTLAPPPDRMLLRRELRLKLRFAPG